MSAIVNDLRSRVRITLTSRSTGGPEADLVVSPVVQVDRAEVDLAD